MQETETIDQVQSKDSLAEKKESSEGSGLLSSIDHNVTDAHTGYNVHREALNEAAVISGDQFHEPHSHQLLITIFDIITLLGQFG